MVSAQHQVTGIVEEKESVDCRCLQPETVSMRRGTTVLWCYYLSWSIRLGLIYLLRGKDLLAFKLDFQGFWKKFCRQTRSRREDLNKERWEKGAALIPRREEKEEGTRKVADGAGRRAGR